jgi:diguanylate cyclase (GGDEF)-like protein
MTSTIDAPWVMDALGESSPEQTTAGSLMLSGANAGKSKLLRLLVRALNRVAEAEKAIVEKDEMIDRLKSMAMTDPLTGLLNRRGFEEHLRRITATAERHGQGGALVYLDLDEFKPINDGIGHEAGDKVLCHVADFLVKNVRETDIVARLGGDEFAVLMVQTDAKEGRTKARVLQSRLNATPALAGKIEIPISTSMGIATFAGRSDFRAVMRRADRAMYRDKAQRRPRPGAEIIPLHADD